MIKKVNHIISNIKASIWRLFFKTRKQKVFCIGLHKTGTTSIYTFAKKYGFKAVHSVFWMENKVLIEKNNFFSDGGSHFDNDTEFDFKSLYRDYPNSLFILQTRDTKKWVVSKCKHAGWNEDTEILEDREDMIEHSKWRYKSLLTVKKFIEHKSNYEHKVKQFFNENDKSRLFEIDLTIKESREAQIDRLIDFLKLDKKSFLKFPHSNKASKKRSSLPKALLEMIDLETK